MKEIIITTKIKMAESNNASADECNDLMNDIRKSIACEAGQLCFMFGGVKTLSINSELIINDKIQKDYTDKD